MEKNKLKIIQITTFFHPVTGGVETQVREISEHLCLLGHNVKVFTSDSSRNGQKVGEKDSKLGEIEIKRFKTWFSFSKFHKFFPGIFIALFNEDFDVIHVHGFRKLEFYIALIVAKLKHKKIVLTTHNPFTADSFRNDKLTKILKIHDLTIGKWFMKFADKVIYITKGEKSILKSKFGLSDSQLVYIPNGINEIYFNKSEVLKEDLLTNFPILRKDWDGIVLAACRMNEVKGLQNLSLAVEKLKNVLFLFIGGDDGYLSKLKGIYRNNENVYFSEKYLKKEELRALMDYSNIFVLPSLHEPFGLTIVEAVACGLFVLATNVGGPKSVLNSSFAEFIEPINRELWMEKIEKYIYEKDKYKNNKKVGMEYVKRYRWENIIPQLEEVYYSK